MKRIAGIVLAVLVSLLVIGPSAVAQEAQLTGDVPAAGGVGLASFGGGSVAELDAAADAQGCALNSVWVTSQGRLVGHVVGAPDFVNAPFAALFPEGMPQGTLVLVVCATPGAPPPGGVEPITLDWTAVTELTLENGWLVGGCGGDAPLRCVYDGAAAIGVVELIDFPAEADLLAALEQGEVEAWFEARIAGNHVLFESDRQESCGADYDYQPAPTEHLTIDGSPAATYGFSGFQDGREVERSRSYLVAHEGSLWIIISAASDPEGCMASELIEFTPAQLAEFEPYFDRLARGSILPSGE